ncbi:LOW QUALITY PROTEIN: transmembrane protein 276 [Rhynochetos jubatus]
MGAAGGCGGRLSHALLCAVSLLCARRARQVTGGPAAGFLLQALAAASDALEPFCPGGPREETPDPLPGSWISAMLGQPLVAFGFHRLSGDRATANLLLGGATALTPVAARLPEDTRLLAARCVTFLTAGSILILSGLTGNGGAALGSLLLVSGNLALGSAAGRAGRLAPMGVLAAGNWALQRALRGAAASAGMSRAGSK